MASRRASPGRVTWRLDTVNGEQGQPLQNAVVATVTFAEAGLSLTMTIQRNLDQTLPASHTINLAFTPMGPEGEKRAFGPGYRPSAGQGRGDGPRLSALRPAGPGSEEPVPDRVVVAGRDVERNTDLLLHRNWFDLALRYTSGRSARC